LKTSHSVLNPIPLEVGLGIHILVITREFSTSEIYTEKYREKPWVNIVNSFLTDRMIGQGWYPNVVEQIRCNALSQYYASLLGPPKRRLNHGLAAEIVSEFIAKTTVADGYVI